MFTEILMEIATIREWQKNPAKPRRDYSFLPAMLHDLKAELPFSVAEIERRKEWLREHAPLTVANLFPAEM